MADNYSILHFAINNLAGQTALRTWKDRLSGVLSVRDFGAVGDGTTNDTAAIQACFDAAFGKNTPPVAPHGGDGNAGGTAQQFQNKAVFFPPGHYMVKSGVTPKYITNIVHNAGPGTNTYTVNSTTGLVNGDLVYFSNISADGFILGTIVVNLGDSGGANTGTMLTTVKNKGLNFYTIGGTVQKAALRLENVVGGLIFGCGDASVIESAEHNGIILQTNGFQYSTIRDLSFATYGTEATALNIDADLPGSGGYAGPTMNTFDNLHFYGGAGSGLPGRLTSTNISAAANNGSGEIRLTVGSTSGFTSNTIAQVDSSGTNESRSWLIKAPPDTPAGTIDLKGSVFSGTFTGTLKDQAGTGFDVAGSNGSVQGDGYEYRNCRYKGCYIGLRYGRFVNQNMLGHQIYSSHFEDCFAGIATLQGMGSAGFPLPQGGGNISYISACVFKNSSYFDIAQGADANDNMPIVGCTTNSQYFLLQSASGVALINCLQTSAAAGNLVISYSNVGTVILGCTSLNGAMSFNGTGMATVMNSAFVNATPSTWFSGAGNVYTYNCQIGSATNLPEGVWVSTGGTPVYTESGIAALSKAGAITTSDVAPGTFAFARDTSGLTTKVYYNNAGTLKSLALT
jgi:hypothetical protein